MCPILTIYRTTSTCGRRHVMPPSSLPMGVELSENREVSSEGKSRSSNRPSSSLMALPSRQPGWCLLGQRVNVSLPRPSSLPSSTCFTHVTPRLCGLSPIHVVDAHNTRDTCNRIQSSLARKQDLLKDCCARLHSFEISVPSTLVQ